MLGRLNPAWPWLAIACVVALACTPGCTPTSDENSGETTMVTYGKPRVPSDEPGPSTLNIDLPNVDIHEALAHIAEHYRIQIHAPASFAGRASLRLRDITWRQALDVLLTPVGYAYIVDGGVVEVMSIERFVRLPLVSLSYDCLFIEPTKLASDFSENVVSRKFKESVTIEGTVVRVSAHPSHVDRFNERFDMRDRPGAANPFRPVLEWPDEIPADVLNRENPEAPWERLSNPDERLTNIFLSEYVRFSLLAERIRLMLDAKRDRLQIDPRAQCMIVTSDAARLLKIGRAIKYLDDPVWFFRSERARLAETPGYAETRSGFERIDHFCLFESGERVAEAMRDVIEPSDGEAVVVEGQQLHLFVRPEHRERVSERLQYASSPRGLAYFPACPGLPSEFPEALGASLGQPPQPSEELRPHPGYHLFLWIDADLAFERLQPFLRAPDERLEVDHLDNQLVFTGTLSRTKAFWDACAYLDDRRWYRSPTRANTL